MGAQCAGCDCCNPTDKPEDALTPSDVTLARMLAVWETWNPGPEEGDEVEALNVITDGLSDQGFIDDSVAPFVLNARSLALLARARKAGVL